MPSHDPWISFRENVHRKALHEFDGKTMENAWFPVKIFPNKPLHGSWAVYDIVMATSDPINIDVTIESHGQGILLVDYPPGTYGTAKNYPKKTECSNRSSQNAVN